MKQDRLWTKAGLTLIFLETLAALAAQFWFAVRQGFSFLTLIPLAFFVAALGWQTFLMLRVWREPDYAAHLWKSLSSPRLERWMWMTATGAVLLTTVWLTPSYRFGIAETAISRLKLFTGWLALLAAQLWAGWRLAKQRTLEKKAAPADHQALLVALIAFLIMLALLALIAWTRWGILPTAQTPWYPAGVPVLPGQVWLLIWVTISLALVLRRVEQSRRIDIWLGLGIWLVTAVLWALYPLPRSFFFPGPYPPNYEIYPYADSASWDANAHHALIGQGLAAGNPQQDHIGLMALLAFLHLLAGENYRLISAILAALMAVFPALMYWMGTSFHSRSAGLFIAGLAIAQELNAFAASNMIDLSHARFLLTEFPTRVGLAALTLALVHWRRTPQKGLAYALPAGGVMALLLLIRLNTLAYLPAILAGMIIFYRRDWKGGVRAVLLFIFSLFLVLSPWLWRNWVLFDNPFQFLMKAENIFKEDFRKGKPSSFRQAEISFELSPGKDVSVAFLASQRREKMDESAISDLPLLLSGHALHNLVTAVLILPTHLSFHDLRRTIYEIHPYWNKQSERWDGTMSVSEMVFLIVNLAVIAVGISAAWKRQQAGGLLPLAMCLVYAFALAIARTSGGRFIVPMDWGALFYWGMGLSHIAFRLGRPESHESANAGEWEELSWRHAIYAILPFVIFTLSMTILDRSMPRRYPLLKTENVFNLLKKRRLLAKTPISMDQWEAFFNQKGVVAYYGMALYPRYYGMGEGEISGGIDGYEPEDYPRLAFTMIGPFTRQKPQRVVFPLFIQDVSRMRAFRFPNASDVIVVGCSRALREQQAKLYQYSVDALFVVLMQTSPQIYLRQPLPEQLTCPLTPPVCKDNHTCR